MVCSVIVPILGRGPADKPSAVPTWKVTVRLVGHGQHRARGLTLVILPRGQTLLPGTEAGSPGEASLMAGTAMSDTSCPLDQPCETAVISPKATRGRI